MSTTDLFEKGEMEAALIENAGEAVIVADAAGVIRFWNPAAESMFGHSRHEAIGATLDLIVPEKLREVHWNGYRETMATGRTQYAGRTLSVPALRADGTRISVSFTVALLFGDDGSVAGIGALMRDVTSEWEEQKTTRRRMAELERELDALRAQGGS